MLAFAGITVAVMQTLLVPVIKDLPSLLGTDPANATWVMTATLLAGAVATPIMGRLGDLNGKRRMLLASLAVMVVGSLICASTDDLVVMIVGRALQGFAMGAIPLGIGIMRDVLPREKLGSAMALMSSSIGVGGGLALPAAAIVAQHADWHALFLASAGLGVLAMTLTVLVVPEPRCARRGVSTSSEHWGSPSAWSACCCRSPRAATGAGPPPHARPDRRVPGDPGAVGPLRAALLGAAGRSADQRTP